jgi:fatty acid-binding protein DegV
MSEADCAAYGVFLVSLNCRVGSRLLSDRIITAEEPVADGEGCSVPPSEADYRARFEELLQTHDGVLCITASRKFSDSNRNASLAAASLGGRVTVIDSGSVAGGLFLLVLRARHMVTLGYPMSRIKAELESYKNSLKVSFTTASIKVLQDAHKLVYKPPVDESSVRRPIFRIEGGSIGVTDFTADDRKTAVALLSVLEDPRRPRPSPSHVVVHYANRTRTVEYLLYRLREIHPSATVYERPITLSIQMNLGHGILGLVGD